jgi:hypothetical protein
MELPSLDVDYNENVNHVSLSLLAPNSHALRTDKSIYLHLLVAISSAVEFEPWRGKKHVQWHFAFTSHSLKETSYCVTGVLYYWWRNSY